MRGMRVSIGSDHAGYDLKEAIRTFLKSAGVIVTDVGTYCRDRVDYPVFALEVGRHVSSGRADRGIVICATGIGVSIAANKISGVRAALCTNTETARLTREHNDSTVLALGQLTTTPAQGCAIARVWLETPFSGEPRHQRRIDQIHEAEGWDGDGSQGD